MVPTRNIAHRALLSMDPQQVDIRLFGPRDSFAVLTALLHRAYARLSDMGLNYTAVDQSVAATESKVRAGTCFVAVVGDRLVGTVLVQRPRPDSPCVWYTRAGVCSAHQFAVAPELQGKGLGIALLSRAEAWAQQEGFSELALDTAEQANHLVDFYARRGYRSVDTIHWPGKTYRSVILAKSLGSASPFP